VNQTERDKLNCLTELMGKAQDYNKQLVDHTSALSTAGINVTQARWDMLFQSLANARKQMATMERKLEQTARDAGLGV